MTGLLPRLALFFLALALPTLILVDAAVLKLELIELKSRIADGALERSARPSLPILAALDVRQTHFKLLAEHELAVLIRRVQDPKGELHEAAADVLYELDPLPVRAALLAANGAILASVPDAWQPLESSSIWRFRHLAKIALPESRGALWIGFDLQAPWWRALEQWRIEWPILLLIGTLFGLSGSWFLARYVTRRIARIRAAAARWSEGNFAEPVGDTSRDELGVLSRQLDGMAGQLQGLMRLSGERRVLEERARLARDLHDVVKQKAFALGLKLGAVEALSARDPQAARVQLNDALGLLAEIQQDLVETIEDLRETVGGALNLAIAERARALCAAAPVSLELDLEPIDALDVRAQEDVLQVLSEALTNSLRHANAQHLTVRLACLAETLSLAVLDDGRGFVGDPIGGQGLRNMRERAQRLNGGCLTITPLARGTQLTLSFRR